MNIVQEYIRLTRKHITNYIKLVLDNKFIKKYSDEYLNIYIYNRYHEIQENNVQLKTHILQALDNKKKELIENYPEKSSVIERMAIFYKYVLYFDNVIKTKDVEKIVDRICEKRKIFKEDETFKQQLLELLENNNIEINKLLETAKCKEFELQQRKLLPKQYVYETKLIYHIEFPILYSKYAIQKAFETGNILEDKLFVEYNLVAAQVLTDIRTDNIKKQYIIEFSENIFKKKQKLKKLIEIIENPTIQERISFKINSAVFEKNKGFIYDLMRVGFKFSLVLDEKFKFNTFEIEKLNIFKHIIVDKQKQYYEDIAQNRNKIKNLIEI